MFIDSTRLSQLNKNIFGHGIFQTKKLIPDSGRMVMPDPSLPKIKRYNIKSNNPLNYLLNTAFQSQAPRPISNPPEVQPPPEPQENLNQQEQELFSQKSINTQNEQEQAVADDELEYKVINLLNEPNENFTFACENKYVKVYKRKVSFYKYLIILFLFYREKMMYKY